jgi:site-specific recombinase XerD
VFFDEGTAAAPQAWLEIRPDNGPDLVFNLTQWGIYLVFRRLAERLHLQPGWYPHNWRRAFARNFIRNGGDLGTLSQLLGHTDLRVTKDFYGDLDDDDLQTVYNRFSPLS